MSIPELGTTIIYLIVALLFAVHFLRCGCARNWKERFLLVGLCAVWPVLIGWAIMKDDEDV